MGNGEKTLEIGIPPLSPPKGDNWGHLPQTPTLTTPAPLILNIKGESFRSLSVARISGWQVVKLSVHH